MNDMLEKEQRGKGEKGILSSAPLPLCPSAAPLAPTLADIERVEAKLLPLPQVEMPLQHLFAPGVYVRVIDMPAGTFVIGHEHKTEHFNLVLKGRARVWIGNVMTELAAPAVFVSHAGVRKVLEILEDMQWATVHPTAGLEALGQDVSKLEDALRIKSASFLAEEQRRKGAEEKNPLCSSAPLPLCAPTQLEEVST